MEQEPGSPVLASARPPAPEPADAEPGLTALFDQLVRLGARRSVNLVLTALIVTLDVTSPQAGLSTLPRALIDEPCHFATAVIALGAITRWRGLPPSRAFSAAMLCASVLIDVDHLPGELGQMFLTAGTPRPYTHALWLVAALAAVAAAARRRAGNSARAQALSLVTAGAALGVCAHFLRDVFTAPIALWWPVSSAGIQLPYGWYAAALVILAITPVRARSAAPAR